MQRKSPAPLSFFSRTILALALTAGGLLSLLALAGVGGCGRSDSNGGLPPERYGTVRVACPPELGQRVVKTFARNWEGQTEGKVQIEPYDPRGAGPPPDVDAWVVPAAALPRWAAEGKLQPLPDSFTAAADYRWRSLLPLYREHAVVWDGKRYGVPLLGESLLCCYRKDWLDDPAHRAAFKAKYQRELAPPATWEQFADVAEYFAGAGKGLSLPPLPADDDELEREFYTIAANYAVQAISEFGENVKDDRPLFSFQYDSTTGGPRLATGGFVHALRLLTRLQAYRPAGVRDDPAAAFGEGRAVFCLVGASRLAAFQKQLDLPKAVGVCPMPCGDGYYDFDQPERWVPHENNRVSYVGGGWLGVVPKDTPDDRAKAALSLLAHLSSPEVSKQIVIDTEVGGRPIRQEHLDASTRWENFGLHPDQTAKMKEALKQLLEHPGLRNPARRLRTPDEAAHRQALEQELRAALKGDKTPEQALKGAAARWEQLDRDKGLTKHRAEYRISLGLRPKE